MLNTDGDPQGMIRHGNERVLRARFNDARFFWQTDQKHPLRDRVEMLKTRDVPERPGQLLRQDDPDTAAGSWLSETIKQAELTVRPALFTRPPAWRRPISPPNW